MVGELDSRQILALASQGAGSAEIASSLGIEEALVNLVIARHDPAADRDINDEQLSALRSHAFSLATAASDESVQARMTMFLLERDKPSNAQRGGNIANINNALILANDSFKKMVEEFQKPEAIPV